MQHTNTPVFMRIGNIHQLKVVFFSVNSNLENAKWHEKAEKKIYNTIFGVGKVGSTPILLLYTQSTFNRSARGVESINVRSFGALK